MHDQRRSSGRFFFFQAEDGIRDGRVTGVQTCALPIFCGQPGKRGGAGRDRLECGAGTELVAIAGESHAGLRVKEAAEMPWRDRELASERDKSGRWGSVEDLASVVGEVALPAGCSTRSRSSRRARGFPL